jgi:pimeloyl-ACP methyl ester carboxylesterase
VITPKTDTLKVPGATLYYEVYGSGPTLLMIHGGIGDAGFYSSVAPLLADDYQVVLYDRRGNSRSPFDGSPTDLVVAEQSDDARRLVEAVGTEPAHVFGNSAGGVIALDFAARHPELASVVIAHEPPVVELLPDVDAHRAQTADVLATYHRDGVGPAMLKFLEHAGPIMDQPEDGQPDEELEQRFSGNIDFFLTREMPNIVRFVPDIATLRTNGANVVLAGGVDSRDAYPYKATIAVAELLSVPVVEFPGDHAGYLGKPVEFAAKLRDVLTP